MSEAGYIIHTEVRKTPGALDNEKRFAQVILDRAVRELDRPFTYEIPGELSELIQVGSMVLVPFSGRLEAGFVVNTQAFSETPNTKEIARAIDEPPLFDYDTRRLCYWIADRYLSSLSQAFRLVLPPGRARRIKQYVVRHEAPRDDLLFESDHAGMEAELLEKLAGSGGSIEISSLKKELGGNIVTAVRSLEEAGAVKRHFVLTEPKASMLERLVVRLCEGLAPDMIEKLTPKQSQLYEYLVANGGSALRSEALKATGLSSSVLNSLEKKQVVTVACEEQRRGTMLTAGADRGHGAPPVPNDAQKAAIERICSEINAGLAGTFLLEGVTGSGKTEVYLRSIEKVLERGKGAIVLVPEISLTPQTVERFESRFPGKVAVLHSKLSPGERYDQWRGLRDGDYSVVVGARSAIFAPVRNLGLIALDEEHEPSYKSDTAPRYHARDVAEMRARMTGSVLVLGSATPLLESLEKARTGVWHHLLLPDRIDGRPLPQVEIVDMKKTSGAGEQLLLSPVLLDALSRTVEAGSQAILFLNRRGFANFLQCRSCGEIIGCTDCEVSMCHHIKGQMLLCHHCGLRTGIPEKCPSCGLGPLKGFGAGTQRVEDELLKHIPGVSFIRMDADTTTSKDAHWRMLGAFARGEAQVLIGTQMIAKGLDIPGVTLVGVVNADTALALPDFRANERTLQLLVQVSGRAGRGTRPGTVVVQSFNPGHPVIEALTEGSDAFLEKELRTRFQAGYPPYINLVNVVISSPELGAVSQSSERLRKVLDTDLSGTGTVLLGPSPAPLSRIRGQYRWHILIKGRELAQISAKIRHSLDRFHDYTRRFPPGSEVRVSVDVDPVSLL